MARGSPSGTPWADIWPQLSASAVRAAANGSDGGVARTATTNPWALPQVSGSSGGNMNGGSNGDHDHSGGARSPLDVPPAWDGLSPETQLPAYLKALEAWEMTTRTIARQRGVAVLSQSSGDLRTLLGTMELVDITSDGAVSLILKLLRREYAWTLQRALPHKFEQALFSSAGQKQKNESFLSYTARKSTALRELAVAGLELPEAARGLIFLRDAQLSRQEADTMATWLQGDYAGEKVMGFLRNLDRLPGSAGKALTLLAEEEEEYDTETWQQNGLGGDPDEEYWGEVEDETLWQHTEDVISEDLAQHIFATMGAAPGKGASGYSQHRAQIQQHRLARGFPASGQTTSSQKGKKGAAQKGKGRDRSLQALIARTRCARCGQIGHWAKSCTNPPNSAPGSTQAGKGQSTSANPGQSASRPAGSAAFTAFFIHGDQELSQEHSKPAILQTMALESPTARPAVWSTSACAEPEEKADIYLHIPANLEEDGEFLAVLDTGAQSGVCGEKRWQAFQKQLRKKGLQPILTSLPAAGTRGIGGEARGIGIYNVPVALGKACGIMTVQVIQGDVPFLVSIAFQKAAQMCLDLSENKAEWRALGTVSQIVSLPSGHIAVNILECDVWSAPLCPVPINLEGALPKFTLFGHVTAPGSRLGSVVKEEAKVYVGAPSCTSSTGRRETAVGGAQTLQETRSRRDCGMVEASHEQNADSGQDGRRCVQGDSVAAEGNIV
eukprot:2741143-Amphidinium_carterae.1